MLSLFPIPRLFSYTCYFPCAYSPLHTLLCFLLHSHPFHSLMFTLPQENFTSHPKSLSHALFLVLSHSHSRLLSLSHIMSLSLATSSLSFSPAAPCFVCRLFLVHSLFLVFFLTAVVLSHVLHLHAFSSSCPHNSSCTSYSLCPHSFTWTCFFFCTLAFSYVPTLSHTLELHPSHTRFLSCLSPFSHFCSFMYLFSHAPP